MPENSPPGPDSKRRTDAVVWLRSLAAWIDLAAVRALARMSALGLLLALAAGAPPADAEDAAPPPARRADGPPASASASSGWPDRLQDARLRLEEAERQFRRANAAYSQSAHHGGQGDALRELALRRTAAQKELYAARRALPKLVDEARAAGVGQDLLSVYEEISR